MQNRTATRRDRVDDHHGRAHAYAGDFSFEGAFVFAIVMRHVRRSAAHVEADKAIEPAFPALLTAIPTTGQRA